MMVRIAIVDDEKDIRSEICQYIENYETKNGEKFTVSVFNDGLELVQNYKKKYDILFLDVKMQKMNGIEAAKEIRKLDSDVIIIFLTNMANYAIKGYSVEALDFMLKPVTYFVFEEQLKKAITRLKKRTHTHSFISLPFEGGFYKVDIAKLCYIESFGHKLMVYTVDEQFETKGTMKSMEEKLKGNNFFRCNNSYLVNLFYVESVRQNDVYVNGKALKISRPKKNAFMNALADYIDSTVK